MDHSYKKQKTILLFSWTVAVLFFFAGSLVISEQRRTNLPNTNIVADNETFYPHTETPSSQQQTQMPPETDIPFSSETELDTTIPSSESESVTAPETQVTPPIIITPPGPPPKYESPDYSNYSAVLKESADAGQEYIDKMVFLGDSRTYGLKHYGIIPSNQIWTPSNGTLTLSFVNSIKIVYPETNELITVKEAVERKKPEILVISLGINGISFMNERSFKGTFDLLLNNVKAASPNTKIILQAMYPAAPSYGKWGDINNEKILRGNQWMVETAQSNGVYFLDAYNILADENGNMADGLHNGDWLHPNAVGYQKIISYIRTHAIIPPSDIENDTENTPTEETTSETSGVTE